MNFQGKQRRVVSRSRSRRNAKSCAGFILTHSKKASFLSLKTHITLMTPATRKKPQKKQINNKLKGLSASKCDSPPFLSFMRHCIGANVCCAVIDSTTLRLFGFLGFFEVVVAEYYIAAYLVRKKGGIVFAALRGIFSG